MSKRAGTGSSELPYFTDQSCRQINSAGRERHLIKLELQQKQENPVPAGFLRPYIWLFNAESWLLKSSPIPINPDPHSPILTFENNPASLTPIPLQFLIKVNIPYVQTETEEALVSCRHRRCRRRSNILADMSRGTWISVKEMWKWLDYCRRRVNQFNHPRTNDRAD